MVKKKLRLRFLSLPVHTLVTVRKHEMYNNERIKVASLRMQCNMNKKVGANKMKLASRAELIDYMNNFLVRKAINKMNEIFQLKIASSS